MSDRCLCFCLRELVPFESVIILSRHQSRVSKEENKKRLRRNLSA